MMRSKITLAGLALNLLFVPSFAQAVVVIDNFDVPANTLIVSATGGAPVDTVVDTSGGTIIGDFRDYEVEWLSGGATDAIRAFTFAAAGVWTFGGDATVIGDGNLEWNGQEGVGMSADLAPGGEDLVYFEYAADLDGADITFTFFDGINAASVTVSDLPNTNGSSGPSELTPVTASLPGGVNYSNIQSIKMELTGGIVDLDFTLDNVRTEAAPVARISLDKTDDVDPVISGSDLTYTLSYENQGTVDVINVELSDIAPAGTTFVDAPGCSTDTADPPTVLCNIGTLAPGDTGEITLIVTVIAEGGAIILNTATLSGDVDAEEGSIEVTAEEDTAVIASAIRFKGKGEGGTGSAGPLELLFGLLALSLMLARRIGRHANSLVMAAVLSAIFATTATSPSVAAEKNWYVGGGVGLADSDISDNDYDSDLANIGYTASSNVDDSDTGWKLFGGYQFNQYLAIEGSYVDLGDVTSNTTVSSPPLPSAVEQKQFVQDASKVHPYSVDGFALVGKLTWPIKEHFSVFAKLGGFRWDADIKVKCVGCDSSVKAKDDESGTDWTGGVGIGYDFKNNVGLRVEWERYGTDRNDVDFYSASILYRF